MQSLRISEWLGGWVALRVVRTESLCLAFPWRYSQETWDDREKDDGWFRLQAEGETRIKALSACWVPGRPLWLESSQGRDLAVYRQSFIGIMKYLIQATFCKFKQQGTTKSSQLHQSRMGTSLSLFLSLFWSCERVCVCVPSCLPVFTLAHSSEDARSRGVFSDDLTGRITKQGIGRHITLCIISFLSIFSQNWITALHHNDLI